MERDQAIACSDTASSSASRSIGGSAFPRFCARRRIPAHAFALKEYLTGAFATKICDKVDAFAALGHSPKLSVEGAPRDRPSVAHDLAGSLPPAFFRQRD